MSYISMLRSGYVDKSAVKTVDSFLNQFPSPQGSLLELSLIPFNTTSVDAV